MPNKSLWSREETLAALHVYLLLPFGQLHQRHPLIKQVASWLGRTPGSVAMKLANIASLDADITSTGRTGLGGASAQDRKIWSEFMDLPALMTQDAARAFDQLAEGNNAPTAIDVVDEVPEVAEGKTRTATVQVRVNQARFRKQVLANYDSACCISGLAHPRLLIASHIVPWSDDAGNRLNPRNGLCLSALHDKAYDAGLLTVLPDYRVRVSKGLNTTKADAFLSATLTAFDGQPIRVPSRFKPDPELLEKHATRFGFV
ncbi:MAG: HNH endonuclease [Burkholderiaceae bacterium]|jgi:hypothetical protein